LFADADSLCGEKRNHAGRSGVRGAFTEGASVKIKNLKKAPRYNGVIGEIVGQLTAGRYPVKIEGRTKPVQLKPKNLELWEQKESSDDLSDDLSPPVDGSKTFEQKLATLVEVGMFDEEFCRSALARCHGDASEAMEYLLNAQQTAGSGGSNKKRLSSLLRCFWILLICFSCREPQFQLKEAQQNTAKKRQSELEATG
jgi:hypothetical protein